ncbi:hypothetical protein CPC08DRAFT_610991, partial [Agrocybe pediades]
VIIDDRDPRIVYSGAWAKGGDPNRERNGTVMASDQQGSSATLQFSGTVWGTINPSGPAPQSSYTIDDGIPVNYTASVQSEAQYQVDFFLAPVSPGQHTLVVTLQGNGSYYLDYIQIIP